MYLSPTHQASKPTTSPLSPQDTRTLEQTRQRLYQLTESLSSLNRDFHSQHPLPSWPSLTSRLTLLSTHLSTLATHLTTTSPLLASLTITPTPTFPPSQEDLLGQLLRKRLEPGVEGWVAEGLARGDANRDRPRDGMGGVAGREGMAMGMGREGMGQDDWKELWEWAPLAANEVAKEGEWLVGEWTPEEKARGVHLQEGGGDGDRGEGEGDEDMEDEEDDDEDDEEDGMKLEEVLRFMSTGVMR
ncbi:hypothetical protein Q9189_001092 [Teloschistes chrysophthalmus]